MEVRATTKHNRVCIVEIITPIGQICKFFEKFFDFLTSVLPCWLQEIILGGCVKKNSSRKMMDFAEADTGARVALLTSGKGKSSYGPRVHAAIVGTGGASICYCLKRCCPGRGTKNDMTLEPIHSFPDDVGANTNH